MTVPRHTHTAGGVVIGPQGLILVVNQCGNSWSLPKGHVEPGEDALTAACREIYEESGITHLAMQKELGRYQRYRLNLDGGDDRSELKTIVMYLFKTHEIQLQPQDPQNPEACWLTPREVLARLTHVRDREFFSEILPHIQPYLTETME